MICLGIESSCDETALALVSQGRLLAAVLASQADVHAIFGGVVPELASREHLRFMGPLLDELLTRSRIAITDIDAIAVARGPGLLGSLLVGAAFAKGLCLALGKPLVGVNHLHAHLLACGLEGQLRFPAIGLVVSGGHTELYRMNSPCDFIRLGRTLDDAAGETFDKVGHALGMRYPAGARIDALAAKTANTAVGLPTPYLDNDNLDFSFSGLKTAAISKASELGLLAETSRQADLASFCLALNNAVADTLAAKTRRALAANPDVDALYVAGGVAANRIIRRKLQELIKQRGGLFGAPSPPLCGDNAAMIAYAGWLLAKMGKSHSLDLESVPRGRPIPVDFLIN